MEKKKRNKALEPDEISIKFLKLMGDRGISLFTSLLNMVNESGEIPQQRNCSTFIPLPKTNKALDFGNYRSISSIDHSLKLLFKINMNRMQRVIHTQIADVSIVLCLTKSPEMKLLSWKRLLRGRSKFKFMSTCASLTIYLCFIGGLWLYESQWSNPHSWRLAHVQSRSQKYPRNIL